MPAPLQIGVYDKTFVRRGMIGAPKFVTVTPRFNAMGVATVGVLADSRIVDRCMADGARLWIRDELGEHLMSGPIVRVRGTGPRRASLLEFDIEDDFRILAKILGWVQPTQPITNQGIAGSNWEMTGAAETVLKAAVAANATRLGLPLTIEPNLGRGAAVTAKLRFHSLFERLFPVKDGAGIEASGIGVRVKQFEGGSGLRLEVYTPSTYPRLLSELSGAIVDWSFSRSRATVTDVVVGGQGEAQLRVFRTVNDSARAAAIGIREEVFRDARDTNDNLVLYARGEETLAEGAQKNGLSVTLSQTKNFRYGKIRVGDKVSMSFGGGVVITDTLREATLSWTQDDGWKTTPRVGERTDDPDRALYQMISKLARTISNQNRT